MPKPTILVIGLGHLGGVTLELLARQDWVGRIVGSSRHPERGAAQCNLARLTKRVSLCNLSIVLFSVGRHRKFADRVDLFDNRILIESDYFRCLARYALLAAVNDKTAAS